ncbi:MAG: GNAT family N-acetyltransferase [Pseudomonadota bacterium]
MHVFVRAAIKADRDAVVAIHCASWRDSYSEILPEEALGETLDQTHGTLWDQIFAEPVPGHVVLVAIADNAIRGFIYSHPDAGDPGIDFISALHVDPEARGLGLGALLMRHWADRLLGIGRHQGRLVVAEANKGAREFYRRLGGVEGGSFEDDLNGHSSTLAREVKWIQISEIAIKARGERIRRLSTPLSLSSELAPAWSGAAHPVDAAQEAMARRKQPLGNPFGLTDFGVNRVEIDPGTSSTIRHYHSHEDEFVIVLEGELTLTLEDRDVLLIPGDCAGFPAGEGPSHVLRNLNGRLAVYLEIGARWPDRDICRYPGEDLCVSEGPDGNRWFLRLDGTPIKPAD